VALHELQKRILSGEIGDGAPRVLNEFGDGRLLDGIMLMVVELAVSGCGIVITYPVRGSASTT
jgi:hypothetical protein